MVVLAPKFASLLAFVVSSSVVAGVDALPYLQDLRGLIGYNLPLPALIPRHDLTEVEVRDHRHKGHRHGSHGHDGHTKVHADDPLIVSGNGNHVHVHSHKRHRHHGHHGTTVYADDPLVVSGNNNYIHSHSHKRASLQLVPLGTRKHRRYQGRPIELAAYRPDLAARGLLDPLLPLVGTLPGVAGVIGLVNMVSHTVLSDTLADLIVSRSASAMSVQSSNSGDMPNYTINASNSSSTTMYLVAQNATANVGTSEQIVLITMPMLNSTDQSVKTYCASYDPNSESASQLSSQPCSYNSYAGLDINSTSSHFSQLFSWNIETGEIAPLWQQAPSTNMVNAMGTSNQPGATGGYVVGGLASGSYDAQESRTARTLGMIFKLASSANNATAAPPASSAEPVSVVAWSSDCEEQADESRAESDDTPSTDASSGDYKDYPSPENSNDDTSPEGVQAYESASPTSADTGETKPTAAIQDATVVTSTFTMLVAPTEVPSTGSTSSSSVVS